jgi:predicted exporter
MGHILAGHNHRMVRLVVVAVVLGGVWLHWRAAFTSEVRAALDDLPASGEHLADLLQDMRDRRLLHRCRAVLADQRAGDAELFEEHRADALHRIDHLERFAPLRRVRPR